MFFCILGRGQSRDPVVPKRKWLVNSLQLSQQLIFDPGLKAGVNMNRSEI